MPLIRAALIGFVALLLAGWSGPARAACTVSGTSLSLGTASTFDLREGRVAGVSGGGGLSCNGSIISVVTSNYARVAATSAGGFRLRDAAGNGVRYRLSADSGGAYDLTGGAAVDYFDPALLRLLGILSADRFAPVIYASLAEAPNLPAGTYTDTVTLNWSWQVCHGVGAGGLCVLRETGSGSVTVTITLILARDCRVSAPDILFGSAPLAAGFAPVRQALAVDCSLGTGFSIAFTAGASGASRPWRAMTGPGGTRLQYNIYRPDGSVWDEAAPLSAEGTGMGSTVPGQLQTYVARVNPDQPDQPAGSYTDTVSAVIGF